MATLAAACVAGSLVAGSLAWGGAAWAVPADDASISGTVTFEGTPVGRALVAAYSWDADAAEYVFEQEAETTAGGDYTLDFLPDGDYTLGIDTDRSDSPFALGESLGGHAVYTSDTPQFSIADGVATSTPFAEVELTRAGGAFSLTITDAGGTIHNDLNDASARLSGLALDGSVWESATAWSDEGGAITVPRVPAGTYAAVASVAGSENAPAGRGGTAIAGTLTSLGTIVLPAPATGELTATAGALSATGTPRVGERLTAVLPSLSDAPESVQYQWYSDGVVIPDATEVSYTPTADHVGAVLSLWVIAHRAERVPYIAGWDSAAVAAAETTAPTEPETPGSTAPEGGSAGTPSSAGGASGDGSLALTGTSAAPVVIAAALLLLGGAALTAARRRRMI